MHLWLINLTEPLNITFVASMNLLDFCAYYMKSQWLLIDVYHLIRYCDNLLSYTFQCTVLLSHLWPQGTWRTSERIILNIMIINDINLVIWYCYWGVPFLCNVVDSRYIRYIKQFWVHITPIRIPGGLQWYLVQWTYGAQYIRPVLSSCGHPLICCLSLISNH